ncbi:iron-containing alcohol dehydrogenase [bacterium]|nr:iron-containing alcohol dehydrogenase [candidate division CSSED10-310 bacterium]
MKTTFNIQQMPFTRFGYQVIREVDKDISQIGAEKILLIIDKEMKGSGLTIAFEQQITSSFSSVAVHVIEEKILSFNSIRKALESIDPAEFDVIVGYGGWRCTDMSKILSIASSNKFTRESVKSGTHEITRHGVPVVSIPTTPPNGAEIDDGVLIRDETTRLMHVFRHPFMIPRLTVIDPHLMITIPPDLTASTGLDALSHALEALISIDASPFSEMYALQGFALLNENIVSAFRQPDNIKARYNVALGSLYAALALNMTGSGAVHAMSYPLSTQFDISHPQASALMLPHVLRYNLPVVPQLMSRIARYFGRQINDEEADASKAIDALLDLYHQLEHPIHLRAYNVPRIELDTLVDAVLQHEDLLNRNPRIIQAENIKAIYESAI